MQTENNKPTATEKLQHSLSYFIENIDAGEASQGIFALLSTCDRDDLTDAEFKALHWTLSLLNTMQRVQSEQKPVYSCTLKIA
jgi:hypothetical protein